MPTFRLFPPGGLAVVALLLLTTCKKDDGLPPETQEGANTFGCKVNGKAWIPNGGPGFMGAKPIEGGYYSIYDNNNKKTRGIFIRAHSKNMGMIHIYLNSSTVGKYSVDKQTNIIPFTFSPKDYALYELSGEYFITSPIQGGEILITKSDTISGILSGSFNFRATKANDVNAVTTVSDGRFDINVRTLQ